MLSAINKFIITTSGTWWLFLIIAATFGATLGGLLTIEAGFPAIAGGATPFDMQNDLTAEQIFVQLAQYTDEAYRSYVWFQIIDYVFPAAGSIFVGSICAFGLRNISPRWFQVVADKKLFVLFLIPALFDYTENISLVWVINAWPEQATTAANVVIAAKKGKLATLFVGNTLSFVVGAIGLIAWFGRRFGWIGGSAARGD